MAERSPIFSKKSGNQKIGYIEDGEAFDLLGDKRCNYCPSTGNLLETSGMFLWQAISLVHRGLLTNYSLHLMNVLTQRLQPHPMSRPKLTRRKPRSLAARNGPLR
jgi:hypothetical protein